MNFIMNKNLKNTIFYCIGILLVAFILQILSFIKGNEIFFPNIIDILKAFFLSLVSKETYLYIGMTLFELLISLLLSFIIGIALGIIAGINDAFYKILKPVMSIIRTVPIIVLILLLMFSVRISFAPVVATSLILTTIVYEGTYQGIKNIDKDLIDVYKLDTNITPNVIFKIYIPLISSHSTSSFVSCLGMGIKILITTEYICGTNNTLGKAVINASQNLEYDKIYAYSFILVILILVIEASPELIKFIYERLKGNSYSLKYGITNKN